MVTFTKNSEKPSIKRMKKSHILIATAIVAALSIVSCKNNNKVQEPTHEEIQEQKQALADSMLSIIDNLVVKYQEAADNADFTLSFVLSDEEKIVKPDYLLDPGLASTFVTKDQKITALGYYLIDLIVLSAYDMPLDENKEAIAKLAAEVNYPADVDKIFNDFTIPASEILKQEYKVYKERNDLTTFWKIQLAICTEIAYIFSSNPDLYLKYIPYETNVGYNNQSQYLYEAIKQLAPYDEDMNVIYNCYVEWYGEGPGIDVNVGYETVESSIDSYKKDRDIYTKFRNERLM